MGNGTVYKEGRQRKNAESKTEKDRNRSLIKKVSILVCALLRKIHLLELHPFSWKYALCVENLIVSHSYDSQKSVQEGKW